MTQEQWKPVVGYESRYEISDSGKLRSIFYVKYHPKPPRYLGGALDKDGYLKYHLLGDDKKFHPKRAARLVAEAFIRSPVGREEVNHKDGIKLNNSFLNLEWVTQLRNQKHAAELGLKASGEACSRSKLTEEQVIDILSVPRILTYKQLAEKHGVTESAINHIMNGRCWQTVGSFKRLPRPM